MDLNVKSVFFLTQRLLPLLEAAGSAKSYARVINIGSIEGIRTSHLEAYSYAASKAGVNHLTRIMAKFLAPKHIAVNAIAPGYFPSKMTAAIDEKDSTAVVEDAPMKRMGMPTIWQALRSISHRRRAPLLRCRHSGRWRACNDGLRSRRMGLDLICGA